MISTWINHRVSHFLRQQNSLSLAWEMKGSVRLKINVFISSLKRKNPSEQFLRARYHSRPRHQHACHQDKDPWITVCTRVCPAPGDYVP